MRRIVLVLASVVLVVGSASAAGAIVGGEVDGDAHPNVGMLRFTRPDGRFRCSGTLVSPTVVVTAAHCTKGATQVVVSFDPVGPADPLLTGDFSRYISGTAHPHPLYNEKLQLKDLLDIGVVVLDQPASTKWPGITPVPLPPARYLDQRAAKGGLKGVPFTVVGYGVYFVQPSDPPRTPESVRDLTRRYTTAPLQNINGETVKLQESAGDAKFGGGTCFGDSGGALLLDGYLVGDTSWSGSQYCTGGTGGYQRTDTDAARAFLAQYVPL